MDRRDKSSGDERREPASLREPASTRDARDGSTLPKPKRASRGRSSAIPAAATSTDRPTSSPDRDGPSVQRTPRSKAELERLAPQLRGRLDPPRSSTPPEGVDVAERDGVRTVTINIHQAVPGDRELGVENQEIEALRDVAAYVNSVDADIIAVQEVRDHDPDANADGVPFQASVLYHLLDAEDMAFTPALGEEGYAAQEGRRYGTSTYTRNGYRIEQAHNVDLPNREGGIEDRSAGIMVVRPPDGGEDVTVVNAHLSAGGEEAELRADQLATIRAELADARDGSMTYRDSISEDDVTATGLPVDGEVILAGDLNSQRGPVDDALEGTGIEHAHQPGRWYHSLPFFDPPATEGIDHVYYSDGFESRSWHVDEVPSDELDEDDGGAPTDHPMVVSDAVLRD